jgi:hypothetical protein
LGLHKNENVFPFDPMKFSFFGCTNDLMTVN